MSSRKIMKIIAIFFLLMILPYLTQGQKETQGRESIEESSCLDCHDDMALSLRGTGHSLSSMMEKASTDVSCLDCHSGGAVHIEDPSKENISNPSRMMARETRDVCFACHKAHVSFDNYGFDPHDKEQVSCTDCHTVHNSGRPPLSTEHVALCRKCHTQTSAVMHLVSSHPVNDGVVACLDCHQYAKRTNDYPAYDAAGVCARCHPAQNGPHLYEHEAAVAYSIEGEGCLACHAPHGSEQNFLLRQPKSSLCRQCHQPPPGHRTNSMHGYVWSQYDDCTVCHSQVHGSFDNRLLLDPGLPARFGLDCFQSGCHSLNP